MNDYKKGTFCESFVFNVEVTHFNKLPIDFIKYDTEYGDGLYYELPKTKLLVIGIFTEGIRWTSEKEKYYKSLIGKEVRIKIKEETMRDG